MRPNLLTTIILTLGLSSPALAQRSLFDQPVQNAPVEAPAPAPVPERPPSSAVPRAPVAAAPAPAPAAPVAVAPQAEAPAQTAEPVARPKRQAKPRKPRGTVPARALAVANKSPNALVGLEVSQDGRAAALKKAVAPGKRTRLALPAFKACEVKVTATFEGQPQAEANVVDICKETSLNFTN